MIPYWSDGHATIWHGNALALPLDDESVDLVVTSPPYFGLRSYQDGCPTCAATGKASMRGYMERYCPSCGKVGTVNKCSKCDRTTLRTDATKAAIRADAAPCPDCNGKGTGHYAGQIGSEPTPAEFVDALIAATREMVRVLKPSGSIWINLGDKYATAGTRQGNGDGYADARTGAATHYGRRPLGFRDKSLMGIPWRYALRCIDDLGLILRAEIIWSKPNGLPESVTDRVRRSHENWFHFVKEPRYYSAVDEVREEHTGGGVGTSTAERKANGWAPNRGTATGSQPMVTFAGNPLGKLPGSVWTVPTQPLRVPAHLGIDHFAAFPLEFPRRIITGWSPRDVCVACGEGRRPVADRSATGPTSVSARGGGNSRENGYADFSHIKRNAWQEGVTYAITGYVCACTPYTDHEGTGERHGNTTTKAQPGVTLAGKPSVGPWREYHFDQWTPADTTPGVVLDPFMGTFTVGLAAKILGRDSHGVDLSSDYCRLGKWRINDPGEIARAMQVEKPAPVIDGQTTIFDEVSA